MINLPETILILDFGSQYTQLIARRLRELKVYCEILPFNTPIDKIRGISPAGLILSGGPASVYEENAPMPSTEIAGIGIPILGICYGMHALGEIMGGKAAKTARREYGPAELKITSPSPLFRDLKDTFRVWMSHGDNLTQLPEGFINIGNAENCPYAVVENSEKKIYFVQFHPEVSHTENGLSILRNFAYEICGLHGNWTPELFIEQAVERIRSQLQDGKALCALSGGVDSSVTAMLMHKAAPEQTLSVFIDNGLLRKGDAEIVDRVLKLDLGLNVKMVDASDRFLKALKGVTNPEQKRKIIGETFIRVFEEHASGWGNAKFLVQGTLYPDVIESVSVKGPSVTIKSHHNVGGLPQVMRLELIEPLRFLFKDEVRKVGALLGLPEEIIRRHPFPGPGLAVRILGEVNAERAEILREADDIFISELKNRGLYDSVSQALCVLLPVKSVGVMGDYRTYENVLALRSVNTEDFMTADWSKLPYEFLARVSNRIINEIKGINRVVYDISTKPPATVEWE